MKPERTIAGTTSVVAALLLTGSLAAQTIANPARKVGVRRVVLVSIPDRQLAVLEDGVVLRTFPVSVGAAVSPSPVGEFQIVSHVARPSYAHNGTVIPAGPNNPLGPRWMGLSVKGYGIHGTNQPRSIGKAASHGCIRLSNRDIVELFPLLGVGDTIEIRAERDEETARIFGGDERTTLAQVHAVAFRNRNHAR